MNLPNFFSIIRLISVIVFLFLFYYNEIFYSLILLTLSAISDLLDGLLARTLKQQTKIGSFLDPLADKVLIITTFTIFMMKNYIPWWFFGAVLSREILVASGWIISYQYHLKSVDFIKPRFLGKMSMFFQMSTMVLVILNQYLKDFYLSKITGKLFFITSILAIISLIDYIIYGRRIYQNQ
jgi:cardiolipin synthase